jgi:hypothetical protein|tara:strand:+ start:4110 stop:4277 length:168 start_codon:yes stop_codon:yes gene_type:complete
MYKTKKELEKEIRKLKKRGRIMTEQQCKCRICQEEMQEDSLYYLNHYLSSLKEKK